MKKQTILIAGAGSGLGKGSAVGLKEGNVIIAAMQTWEQMSPFIEEATDTDYGKNIELIKLDILDYINCEKAWKHEIDILVNNAAIRQTGPLAVIPVELVYEVTETNAFSTLEFSQRFIKKIIEKGKGKVAFVSSVAGLITEAFLGLYNASKYVLEAIVHCLRDDLKPIGVTVVYANTGLFETGFNDRMYNTNK